MTAHTRQLTLARTRRRCVRVYRSRLGPDADLALPLALSRELLLFASLADLEIDGFSILRLADLTKLSAGPNEAFADKVLSGEGGLAAIRRRASFRVAGWKSVFEALRRRRGLVIIECEAKRDSDFLLGHLVGVRDDAVGLHYVDATGSWDREAMAIPFRKITKVSFALKYLEIIDRYGDPRPRL